MHTLNAQATVSIDGSEPYRCEATIEQDMISVRSEYATKPDPAWGITDEQGHFHSFIAGGKLPTLRTEQVPCDGACGDPSHTVTKYSCLLCGQEIEPRSIPDTYARSAGATVPGRKSATVEVYSDRPIGERGAEVSVRVLADDGAELIGVGTIVGHNSVFSGGEPEFTTTIAARFLEPRLTA